MIKKEIAIGFIIGILSNITGMLIYIFLFSEYGVLRTLRQTIGNEFLGTLIAAGAILNFLPFFVFLNKKKIYRARGVLLASIFAALCIAVIKFL
ncbi:MAG TPA: hypothetical protein VFM60_02350 [Salinimicrobium sp.]|nr:hypothetical protein [Salinimicrobium sp.]